MVKFPLFMLLACGFVTAAVAEPPHRQGIKVRQVIIRAPQADVAIAALEHADDQALADVLRHWVQEGKAQVVSELRKDGTRGGTPLEASSGRYVDWPSERSQDYENLILEPTAWQTTFIGASMNVQPPASLRDPSQPRIAPIIPVGEPDPANVYDATAPVTWIAGYSPRGPVNVEWPIVWPQNLKPRVAWLDQPDFFQEKTVAIVPQGRTGATVLAIVPPADSWEPNSPNKNSSDIILAEVETSKLAAAETVAIRASRSPATARVVLVGIGVGEADALDLLQRHRSAAEEGVLLGELLQKVTAGAAHLRFFCASATSQGNRTTLTSGREYVYPTEMPTIPSAWQTETSGLDLTCEYVSPGTFNIVLKHNPNPARDAVWRCATDAPEMVMRQPQFFAQSLATSVRIPPKTPTLISTQRTPACLGGPGGLISGETLFVFARLHEAEPGPVQQAADAAVASPAKEQLQVESVIFDLPASEAEAWKDVAEGAPDEKRFTQLLDSVREGRARIASNLSTRTSPNDRATIGSTEGFLGLTEGEPDYLVVPGRFRPTAFERYPIGATWEVEASIGEGDHQGKILLNSTLQIDTQRPRHASLEEMIAFSKAHADNALPPLVRFQETWNFPLLLSENTAHFLGLQHPPGDENKGRIHVAFARARSVSLK